MSTKGEVLNLVLFTGLILLNLFVSVFWVAYFIFKIKRCRVFLKVARRNLEYCSYDDNSLFELVNLRILHTDKIKYYLMLSIVLLEALAVMCVWIYHMYTQSDLTLKYYENITNLENICEGTNITQAKYIQISKFWQFGITQTLYLLPNALFLISISISISLTKLIAMQMKHLDAWHRVRAGHINRLIVTITLSIISVIIIAIPQTRLFGMPVIIIIFSIYLFLFYINVSRLRKALLQYAYERLIQYGNNRVELSQLKRYKVLSTLVMIGMCLTSVCILMDELLFQVTSILYFGKCYIPLIYNIPYTPILQSTQQQLILFQVSKYGIKIITALLGVSLCILLVPILLSSILNALWLLYKRFKKGETLRYNYDLLEKQLLTER